MRIFACCYAWVMGRYPGRLPITKDVAIPVMLLSPATTSTVLLRMSQSCTRFVESLAG